MALGRLFGHLRYMFSWDRQARQPEDFGPSRVVPGRGNDGAPQLKKGGLNIVGFLRARTGVGESARLALGAAKAAGIPCSLIEFPLPGVDAEAHDSRLDHVASQQEYAVNLFFVNADVMLAAERYFGPDFFSGHYNIGYWAWELPRFPDSFRESFRSLQEIWVPSDFVREALASVSPLPVFTMPHPVHIEVPRPVSRNMMGLPERAFLFLTMFDVASVPARKNPLAALQAFQKAFPNADENVRLIIKVAHGEWDAGLRRTLRKAAMRDHRLIILDRMMTRAEINTLLCLCDAFVSLHRAEGFGLGIAEAMYLGKPVIATNWSGNTDFMGEGNSCPVDFELTPLRRTHGPYHKAGQFWAEPRAEHAASWMRTIREDSSLRERLSRQAMRSIRETLSPERIGMLYRTRLHALGLWQERETGQRDETPANGGNASA